MKTYLLLPLLLFSCGNTTQETRETEDTTVWVKNTNRVKEEIIEYTGVTILTVDNHEYISYRDGSNAASVGGLVHKEDCKCKQK